MFVWCKVFEYIVFIWFLVWWASDAQMRLFRDLKHSPKLKSDLSHSLGF